MPSTKAAAALLAWLRGERQFWADTAEDDTLNTFMRHAAVDRRDQLDMLLQRMPRELVAVEQEMGMRVAREVSRLDALLDSVPA